MVQMKSNILNNLKTLLHRLKNTCQAYRGN